MKTAESPACVRGGAQILTTAESPEEEREVERAGEGERNTFGYGRDFCLLFESKALGLFFVFVFICISPPSQTSCGYSSSEFPSDVYL